MLSTTIQFEKLLQLGYYELERKTAKRILQTCWQRFWTAKSDGTSAGISCGEVMMPRFNSLWLASMEFTSQVDTSWWLNSGLCLPLIERMFILRVRHLQGLSRGDRMNHDITGYEMIHIEEYPVWPRKTYIRECEAVYRVIWTQSLVHTLL